MQVILAISAVYIYMERDVSESGESVGGASHF